MKEHTDQHEAVTYQGVTPTPFSKALKKVWGFTLLEIVFVVALIALASAFAFVSLSEFRGTHQLEGAREQVFAAFERARTNTIAGQNDTAYGIHLATSTLVVFQAPSYTPSAPDNQAYELREQLVTDDISLAGGGRQIMFQRLTGETDNTGTFSVGLKGDNGEIRFEVDKTGNIRQL